MAKLPKGEGYTIQIPDDAVVVTSFALGKVHFKARHDRTIGICMQVNPGEAGLQMQMDVSMAVAICNDLGMLLEEVLMEEHSYDA